MIPDLDKLNPDQREAVTCVKGPLLVLAGAGSGKTRVITYKVAHLVFDHGVSPGAIMALTFTNKAAREMAGRIEAITRLPVKGMLIGTFHSVCARLLRRERVMGGAFTIFDTDDQKKIIREVLNKLGWSDSRNFSPGDVQGRISGLKNRMITPKRFEQQVVNVFDEQFAAIYRKYEEEKKKSDGMDFDDLLLETVALLMERADVLERYRRRVEHLLVDEYQDTNLPQYEMVRLLSGLHRNITVVGDDDQSIYSWRGSDLRNILEFEKAFPDAKTVRLTRNYRSTGLILEAANAVIGHNKARKEKSLWTDGPRGEKIDLFHVQNEQEEAREIVLAVRTRALKEAAVFYRTNSQSRAIEDELRNAGIPYAIVGGLRFYERREIKDLLAYLRLLANPRDAVSLSRVINVPRRGIGDQTWGKLAEYADRNNLSGMESLSRLDAMESLTARERGALSGFRDLMADLSAKRSETDMVSFAGYVTERTKYLEYLRETADEQADERIENVSEFVNAMGEYVERTAEPALEGFLEEVALMTDLDEMQDEAAVRVILMTLHASKGLEFDDVFITGLEDGLFPISRAEEAGDIEEERRLFYVGLTRARKRLALYFTAQRRRFGTTTSSFPSPFLAEVPDACLRKIDRVYREERPVRAAPPPGPRESVQQPMPLYEDFSQEDRPLQTGTKVRHPIWGRGIILSLSGFSDNMKAVIRFDNSAVKKVMVKYAKLEPVHGN